MDDAKTRYVFSSISGIFNSMAGLGDAPLHWFFCFGTLKEYMCDRTFSLDYDIDIGVLYDQYSDLDMIRVMAACGWNLQEKLVHDRDGKALNMHFKAEKNDRFGEFPSVDVYAWYGHGNILYHTYDVNREKAEIPKKYVFKGVKKEWIIPDPREVAVKRTPTAFCVEANRFLTPWGTWNQPIFEDMGDVSFTSPYSYGALLDEWYYDWITRHRDKSQSGSRWVREVKRCKDLK